MQTCRMSAGAWAGMGVPHTLIRAAESSSMRKAVSRSVDGTFSTMTSNSGTPSASVSMST